MRISDWSSDVCSSDLNDNLIISKLDKNPTGLGIFGFSYLDANKDKIKAVPIQGVAPTYAAIADGSYPRSEEHTSELQSLMRISYAVFCLKKKKTNKNTKKQYTKHPTNIDNTT